MSTDFYDAALELVCTAEQAQYAINLARVAEAISVEDAPQDIAKAPTEPGAFCEWLANRSAASVQAVIDSLGIFDLSQALLEDALSIHAALAKADQCFHLTAEIDTSNDGLLITSTGDGFFSEDCANVLVQTLIKRFDLRPVGWASASFGGRSTPGTQGGAAFFVTADEIREFSTWDWLDSQQAEFANG